MDDLDKIPLPFGDVMVFVQEKWRISGTTAGSGNTTNIGSITGLLADFESGKTPFSSKAEFLEYWRGYGKDKAARDKLYNDITTFRNWKAKNQP